MRIAMLSWESLHSVAAGGVAAHVTELAAALERAGHDVHVFTRSRPHQEAEEWHDGVCYHLVEMPSRHQFIDGIALFNKQLVARFDDVSSASGPFDVVHAHDWLTVAAMSMVEEHFAIPSILTVHSTEYGRSGNVFSPADDSVRIIEIERLGMLCASHVIAVSAYTKRELIDAYAIPASRISVIHNGCQYREFDGFIDAGRIKESYGIAPLDPMLLFAGRATVQKGPDLLLEAIPAVLDAFPQARFLFSAGGEMEPVLHARAAELGLGHAVRFAGHVSRGCLVDLLRASDGVVVPSRNEPFGIIVLEAWAAGKPVVVTRRGGPDEFVRDGVTGIKVTDSPASIAAGVRRLLSDYQAGCQMGQAGRFEVETSFSWDRIATETMPCYAAHPHPINPTSAPSLGAL